MCSDLSFLVALDMNVSKLKNYQVNLDLIEFSDDFNYKSNFCLLANKFLNDIYNDLIVWGDKKIIVHMFCVEESTHNLTINVKYGYPFIEVLHCNINLENSLEQIKLHSIIDENMKQDKIMCLSSIDQKKTMFEPFLQCIEILGLKEKISNQFSNIILGHSNSINIGNCSIQTYGDSYDFFIFEHKSSKILLKVAEEKVSFFVHDPHTDKQCSFELYVNSRFADNFRIMAKSTIENYYEEDINTLGDFLLIKEIQAM